MTAHGLRCAITSTPDKAPTHPCAHSTPNVASRCLSLSTRDIRACPGTTPDYLHVYSSDVCRCCGCSIDCPGTTTRPPRSGNHVPPVKQSRAPTDATSHTRTSRHEGNSNPFTAGHFNHSRAPVRPQYDQHAAQAPQGRTCTSAKVWHLRSWSPLLLR